jgi:uncharacterized protein (DUF885 family)
MNRRIRIGRAGIAAMIAFAAVAAAPAPSGQERLPLLVRSYMKSAYAFNPSFATYMGVHDYDERLENWSKAAIKAQAATIRKTLLELSAIDREMLDPDTRIDFDLFRNTAESHLFQWTELKNWEQDPGLYGYGWAIESLIARDFAPPDVRLRAVIARLGQVPRQFANARANLKNPPRLFTDFAAEDLEGSIAYLDTDVPRAFAAVKDSALWRRYDAAKRRAQDATRAYVKWLRETLAPRSTGSFVLGEEKYLKRLKYEEMIELPVDTILAVGARELARLEARYRDAARRIAPTAPLDSVVAMMRHDHPTREGLLDEVRAMLAEIRDYCVSSKFITLPSEVPVQVRPTPEFAASRSFASFDGPGPLEEKARDSYYNVTLPAASWDSARVEQHLQGYNRWSLTSVSIHEVYPGHYVHFLYMPQAPTYARKTMGCGSFAEGWGLYTEEALFDHGYAAGDPKREFGMLRWSLVRSCRLQVGLRVHTRGMSLDEATQFFVDHAGMERQNAEREASRAAFDPTYIVYTVGALQIRKLRDDVKAKEGDAFDLARFHARILSQGSLPVKLLRRLLLDDDGPTL